MAGAGVIARRARHMAIIDSSLLLCVAAFSSFLPATGMSQGHVSSVGTNFLASSGFFVLPVGNILQDTSQDPSRLLAQIPKIWLSPGTKCAEGGIKAVSCDSCNMYMSIS